MAHGVIQIHLYIVGPTSGTLGHRCTIVIQMFGLCWVCRCFRMTLKSLMTWLSKLPTFVSAAYTPKGTQIMGRLRVCPSCDGTCSASIWLKVTSCLTLPGLSSSTTSESRSRPQYGVGKRCSAAVYGSSEATGQVKPVTTDELQALKAIIEMVRCQCRGFCFTAQWYCRSINLSCTDLRMMRTLWLTCC